MNTPSGPNFGRCTWAQSLRARNGTWAFRIGYPTSRQLRGSDMRCRQSFRRTNRQHHAERRQARLDGTALSRASASLPSIRVPHDQLPGAVELAAENLDRLGMDLDRVSCAIERRTVKVSAQKGNVADRDGRV